MRGSIFALVASTSKHIMITNNVARPRNHTLLPRSRGVRVFPWPPRQPVSLRTSSYLQCTDQTKIKIKSTAPFPTTTAAVERLVPLAPTAWPEHLPRFRCSFF